MKTHIFGKISVGKSDRVCQEYRYATWRHVFEVNDEMQIIFHKRHNSHDVKYHVFVFAKLLKNFELIFFTENFESKISHRKFRTIFFSTKIRMSNFKSHSCVDLNFFLL